MGFGFDEAGAKEEADAGRRGNRSPAAGKEFEFASRGISAAESEEVLATVKVFVLGILISKREARSNKGKTHQRKEMRKESGESQAD